MSSYLVFTDDSNYVSFNTPYSMAVGDVIEVKFTWDSSGDWFQNVIDIFTDANQNVLYCYAPDKSIMFNCGTGALSSPSNILYDDNTTPNVLQLERTATHYNITVNGSLVISEAHTGQLRNFVGLSTNFADNMQFSGKIEYCKIFKLGVLVHHWSAAISSHLAGAVILIDTVAGNNGTGYFFPTDGSAWETTATPPSNDSSSEVLLNIEAPIFNIESSSSAPNRSLNGTLTLPSIKDGSTVLATHTP